MVGQAGRTTELAEIRVALWKALEVRRGDPLTGIASVQMRAFAWLHHVMRPRIYDEHQADLHQGQLEHVFSI